MTYRGYEPGPSDPGVLHQVLIQPGMSWPTSGEVSLELGVEGDAVRRRWRALFFETAGTVLLKDEAGLVLPYSRSAGAVLAFSPVAIVRTHAHGISGLPTETSASLVLYGVR